mmetsp:Transcript_62657/g.147379  ORF Transcript_62657/g.147379 Transcript_62657/m.147379 type:complete len:116 (-) Transcript_62657:2340-2687(-)
MSHHTSKVNEGNVQSTGGDIDTSSPEVDAAIQAVRTPGSETRWAVLGYEGNTGKLKLVETGDGPLEDLRDELSDGKIHYAYWRAVDSQAPKFVVCIPTIPPTRPTFRDPLALHLA